VTYFLKKKAQQEKGGFFVRGEGGERETTLAKVKGKQ